MNYPIKTLNQLPLMLKGFRKERGLTQAAIAEKLGITQQSYAYFEANPTTASLDRLFMVLRILGVEISLEQAASVTSPNPAQKPLDRFQGVKARGQQNSTRTVTNADIQPARIVSGTQENW